VGVGRGSHILGEGNSREGRGDILGHNGVLEAIAILLGAAIARGPATVGGGPDGVRGAAIARGPAPVRGALAVQAVLSSVVVIRAVLVGVLGGRARVGMGWWRVRRQRGCQGGAARRR